MRLDKVVDAKINMLVDLMLTDGVGPSEFAENIFTKEYNEVSFYKNGEYIVGKLVFVVDDKITEMKYTYTINKKLIRIEERINSKFVILWDREMREDEIIREIILYMNNLYKPEQILKFINSLPLSLQQRFLSEMGKTA